MMCMYVYIYIYRERERDTNSISNAFAKSSRLLQVLLERPENPVPFMVKWLANQTQQASISTLK